MLTVVVEGEEEVEEVVVVEAGHQEDLQGHPQGLQVLAEGKGT